MNARPLLRPAAPAPAAAYFDDVRFGKTVTPGTETPNAKEATPSGAEGDGRGAEDIESVALGAWAGPTTLAKLSGRS